MEGNNLIKKGVVVAVILLFVSMSVIPSAPSKQISKGSIITVDDEGDGDYTSIKEAVDNATPGDTIQVYSGFYEEQRINIYNASISLIGIPYELGDGNDTGKPFIEGKDERVFFINANNICLKNFHITNKNGDHIILIYHANNPLISDNILNGSQWTGIYCNRANTPKIFNNTISNVSNGIRIYEAIGMNISNNDFNTIKNEGIYSVWSTNIVIFCNRFKNCGIGIYLEFGYGPKIIQHNNFMNNNVDAYFKWTFFPFSRNYWIRNYWSDWIGIGPKKISGDFPFFIIPRPYPNPAIEIILPWPNFDWHPAKEPYDIGVG